MLICQRQPGFVYGYLCPFLSLSVPEVRNGLLFGMCLVFLFYVLVMASRQGEKDKPQLLFPHSLEWETNMEQNGCFEFSL